MPATQVLLFAPAGPVPAPCAPATAATPVHDPNPDGHGPSDATAGVADGRHATRARRRGPGSAAVAGAAVPAPPPAPRDRSRPMLRRRVWGTDNRAPNTHIDQEKAMSRWLRRRPKGQDLWVNEPEYEIRTDPDGGAPTLWAVGPDDEKFVFYGHDSAAARELAENVERWADAMNVWEAAAGPQDPPAGPPKSVTG